MERDVTPPAAGQERVAVGRGQNTILTLPHDAGAIRHFLNLLFERLEPADEPAIQAVILTADVETVMAIGRAAAAHDRPAHATVLAVPSAKRGARALRSAVPSVLIATPDDLLSLLRESLTKLHAVRTVVFAWAEDLLAFDDAPLATVIAELPKEASRMLVTARLTPDVTAFAERYVRRIARAAPVTADLPNVPVSYVTVADAARPSALRRVLDTLDPESATVYARTEEGERNARAEVAGMGTAAVGVEIVTRPEPTESALLVLYEIPTSPSELRALASAATRQTVALVRGREMPLLRSLTSSAPRALALAGPADRARARETAARDAIRAVLADGVPSRELLALEPLLEEYDGVEIAAAALKLLDRARESRPAVFTPAPAPQANPLQESSAPQPAPATRRGPVRVFINAGTRDGAAARDFVGAIANVAGIPADRIGKVEVRDSHALVELQGRDAEMVVEKLAGATIKGRRVAPRLDRDRPAGEGAGDRPREQRGTAGKRGGGARDRTVARYDRPGAGTARERGSVGRGRSEATGGRSGPRRERGSTARDRSSGPREGGGTFRGGSDRNPGRSAPPRRESTTSTRGRRST